MTAADGKSRVCTLCPSPHYSLGYCRRHYRAYKKWGDPNSRPATLAERILANYVVDETGCWIWKGQLNNKGYGLIWSRDAGQKIAAHRVAYELLVGPIPAGLELDHTCETPACVNPAHLEPVTHAENMRRIRDRQMACRRAGHDWTDPRNVYRDANGGRRCRACAREADRARAKAKPAAR